MKMEPPDFIMAMLVKSLAMKRGKTKDLKSLVFPLSYFLFYDIELIGYHCLEIFLLLELAHIQIVIEAFFGE
jgi:hypothetical protein